MRYCGKQTNNCVRKGMLALVLVFLLMSAVTADSKAYPFSMPEEHINYRITFVNGVLWAKIDGIYPLFYAGNESSVLMFYPTPPGTTNISISMNDRNLGWNNYSEVNPDFLHHTAIGDWAMISTVLEPIPKDFVLKIHYEHPIEIINGSYTFLYDLNIVDYLSASENRSIAHFAIHIDAEFANFNVNTVFGLEEALKPIEYTVSGDKQAVIKIDEISEYGEPLPGDLLVSFSLAEPRKTFDHLLVAALLLLTVIVVLAVYRFFYKSEVREK